MSVNPAMADLATDAARATSQQHSMSLLQGLRTYPHAVMWSVVLSAAIVMDGFDKVLINNLYAYPPFQREFGVQQPDGSYELTATWQSALSNGALVGEIIGLMINGLAIDKFGYRRTMAASLVAVALLIFIPFFANNIETLLAGQILMGITWGVFQTITTAYAADVCPVSLRAYLTTYVNMCWVIGQFIASGVLKGVGSRDDKWGYKIPFALQWVWPVPIIIGVVLAPESPWWLVRKDRINDAKRSQLRLISKSHGQNSGADDVIAMIQHTDALEKAVSAGTAYWDCLKKTDLRRTIIVCCTWTVQILCGSTFMGYSTYFYTKAGLDTSHAFSMSLGQYALGIIGTMFSWVLMGHFGRRTLYLAGEGIMCILLLVIGLAAIAEASDSAKWAIGTMLLLYTFVYDATVGPVCYALVSELPSTRLRAKSIVLARNCYNIAGIITNIITPRMLNTSAWDWGAKSGFFWAGLCGLCFVWSYFYLPEPKGRTFGELDVLFEHKISARKFKMTPVDPFMSDLARRQSLATPTSNESRIVQTEEFGKV
ncbi:putative sugar transporter [Lineolata rhizophorae]|uniref:Putative sugar transporter n=1 Tax=Lineolata rhizophorae TaxID=578093 RepID=A0A6A6P4J7_9PEZI|nr:putative sugar transporter [Lineolata rhizophorae]